MRFKTLVVDDEIWMCEGLKKVIHTSCPEFEVNAAAMDGVQALKLLQTEPFDLVITDIRMPKMDGLELLKRMRGEGMDVPVILFTGHSEFEYAQRAIRLGVTDYLLKPLDKKQLTKVLNTIRNRLTKIRNDGAATSIVHEHAGEEWGNGKQMVEWLRRRAHTSYMEELSVTELAEAAGFNPSYASRLFKEEVGKSFVQFLTETRMEAALQLLNETELPVSQVARRVGYWDVKHFSKMFKKVFGESPIEYRGDCKKHTPQSKNPILTCQNDSDYNGDEGLL